MTVERTVVLDDRYVLEDLIGSGGMAEVYRATDRVLQRRVAIKLLRETSAGAERERFVAEAHTLASLDHPGLITLLDAGFRGDRPYLVMELIEGTTLSQALKDGALDPDEVARVGAAVARALAFAHAAGVVHRDVKPANVLLCEDGRVLLADFGIARLVGATSHHTRTGDTIGSPAYLAPEQVIGGEVTPAADVYSLGLVLLEASTGVRAYGGTPIESALARLSVEPEIPASLGPDRQRLFGAMIGRDPQKRPSAAEVAAALDRPAAPAGAEETRVLDLTAAWPVGTPGEAPGEAPGEPGGLGRPWLAALVALATVSLVVGGVLLFGGPDANTKVPPPQVLPSAVPSHAVSPTNHPVAQVTQTPRPAVKPPPAKHGKHDGPPGHHHH